MLSPPRGFSYLADFERFFFLQLGFIVDYSPSHCRLTKEGSCSPVEDVLKLLINYIEKKVHMRNAN